MLTKFDTDTKKLIIEAVKLGATRKLAADYAGIREETLSRWLCIGQKEMDLPENERGEHYKFCQEVKKAEGQMAFDCLARIEEAGKKGQWQADAWKLERIHSKYYSRDSAVLEFNQRLQMLEEQQKGLAYEEKPKQLAIEDNS